jgi:hypothetical protein
VDERWAVGEIRGPRRVVDEGEGVGTVVQRDSGHVAELWMRGGRRVRPEGRASC